jgi:elongation factor P--(R)-beta-lysine ligase
MSLEFKDTISSKIEFLKLRALALNKARSFFTSKDYIEVDVPSIVKYPAIDTHIDSFEVKNSSKIIGYLHTSPEYLMKRLLSNGMTKIFYAGHVFRIDEIGRLHNLEFTMIEWYQVGLSFNALINETLDFCKNFIGDKKVEKLSYQAAFLNFLQIDPFLLDTNNLMLFAQDKGICIDSNLDKDSWLQLLFSYLIEPQFEKDTFYVISNYPPSQAALSKTKYLDKLEVAERFEIYYNQIELANGYFELNNSTEQKKRFDLENKKRKLIDKKIYPIDEKFVSLLDFIPDCSGVSVGFDRLLMLAYKKKSIDEVLSFSFNEL